MPRPKLLGPNRSVNITLEHATLRRLESIRIRTRRSVSELARIAIQEFLDRHEAREREALA